MGFETSLGLGLQYLVKSGVLTLNELIEKMAVNPSRILRINKGSLSIDADADITIFDQSKEWTVDKMCIRDRIEIDDMEDAISKFLQDDFTCLLYTSCGKDT